MSNFDPLAGCDPEIVRYEYKPGKVAWLRALDGAGRDAYLDLLSAAAKGTGMMKAGEIAALGIIRSETDHAIAYVTEEQKAVLNAKDGALLKALAEKVLEISGLREKAVEEEEKKS